MRDANRLTLARHMAATVDGLSVQMAGAALDALISGIHTSLAAGQTIRLAGLGQFAVRYRGARQTWHPRTREPVQIAAAIVPYFSPAPLLRQAVQQAPLDPKPLGDC